MIVVMFASFLAALMCYFPLLLLLPVTVGVFYLLYRDIYGPPPPLAPTSDEGVIDADVID
jgi:hypothetical protein